MQADTGRIVKDLAFDEIPSYPKLGLAGKAEGFKSHEIQEERPPDWVQ